MKTSLWVILFVMIFLSAGCKGQSIKNEKVKREPIVCVIAIDGTRSYKYTDKAKHTTMKIIESLSGNAKVYVRWITEDSTSDKNAIVTVILPDISKPKDPFNTKAKERYNASIIKLQNAIKQSSKVIMAANNPNARRTDIYGALYASSVRFASNTNSKKVLILLTDMDDNVGNANMYKFNLENVSVKIMDFQTGIGDDQRRERWQKYLTNLGAVSVDFVPIDEPFNLEGI